MTTDPIDAIEPFGYVAKVKRYGDIGSFCATESFAHTVACCPDEGDTVTTVYTRDQISALLSAERESAEAAEAKLKEAIDLLRRRLPEVVPQANSDEIRDWLRTLKEIDNGK